MRANRWRRNRGSRQSGQVMVVFVLALGLFLLGAISFALDMGNLWYRRQSAQNAADAACMAGAMDMLINASGASTGHQGFTIGTAFDCSSNGTAVPCKYAAYNGYDGKNTTPGSDVYVSFPTTSQVKGVPSAAVPDPAFVPNAFMRVDILDHVQTYFAGMLTGKKTQDVRAFAACGTVLATSPIPLVVLHPTQASSLQGNGTGEIKILGGPTKSIQVNSGSTTAVSFGGTIDLSQGGPSYNGSQLGTFGGPATPTGTFLPGPTYWIDHSAPIADPFKDLAAPTCTTACLPQPPPDLTTNLNCSSANIKALNCLVDYGKTGVVGKAHGCPDPNGCTLLTAGYYDNTVSLKKGGSRTTFLFDPGVYYIKNGITADSNSVVRTSTYTPPSPNNIAGVMFYLTGSPQNCGAGGSKGLVCFDSNSGSKASNSPALDTFDIDSAQCPGGPAVDANLKTALAKNGTPYTGINGNLLLGPCTGTYGLTTSAGQYRGMLFFQDRSVTNVQNAYGGGGSSLTAGSMYFHESSTYTGQLQLQGNSGSTSFILGEIVVDTLGMGGTPDIDMVLNPNKTNSILKATLVPWSNTSN
jgi:Putative Flp pilus-assembly TadE/G-like